MWITPLDRGFSLGTTGRTQQIQYRGPLRASVLSKQLTLITLPANGSVSLAPAYCFNMFPFITA